MPHRGVFLTQQPDPIITVLPEEWKKVQRRDFQRNLCFFFSFKAYV